MIAVLIAALALALAVMGWCHRRARAEVRALQRLAYGWRDVAERWQATATLWEQLALSLASEQKQAARPSAQPSVYVYDPTQQEKVN